MIFKIKSPGTDEINRKMFKLVRFEDVGQPLSTIVAFLHIIQIPKTRNKRSHRRIVLMSHDIIFLINIIFYQFYRKLEMT